MELFVTGFLYFQYGLLPKFTVHQVTFTLLHNRHLCFGFLLFQLNLVTFPLLSHAEQSLNLQHSMSKFSIAVPGYEHWQDTLDDGDSF